MARIPFLSDAEAGPAELVSEIKARRGGNLAALDRILLHSPPVAQGWGPLMGRVRNELALPAKWRELAMCAVAVLNGAEYEWVHHLPLYRAAGGSEAQAAALRRLRAEPERALQDPSFDAAERALLQLAIESTLTVTVAKATFEAARAVLPDDRQLFEFVMVVASYNMVSRILVALEVRPED
jgi:alkylhydroperoxidase family enzyme